MTQTFNDVQISGTADVVQLGIKANATQTNAIQLWQDSGSNPLARVTSDGRFQIGNNIVSGPTDALIQANYNPTGSMPISVWHAPGVLTTSGTVGGTINWVFHELQLAGSSLLNGVQNALYTKLTNSNIGNSGSADLRAATFQVISSGGNGGTPVAKATGARLIASNSGSAYLSQAIGVEATISNDTGGSITSATAFSVTAPSNSGTIGTLYGMKIAGLTQGSANYALYTNQGFVYFGDRVGINTTSPTTGLDFNAGANNGLRIRGATTMSTYLGEIDPGDFQWRSNLALGALTPDDTTKPQWAVALTPTYDEFAVLRSPAGSTFSQTQLFKIDNAGNTTTSGSIITPGNVSAQNVITTGNVTAYGFVSATTTVASSGNMTVGTNITVGGTVTTQAVGVNVTPTAWLDAGSGASNGLRIRGLSNMSTYLGQVSDLGDFQWRANLGFNATTPDNTSYPQWAVRLHTNTVYDNFTIYRSPAGSTASLAQLFQIDNAGNVNASGNVSTPHLIGNSSTPTIAAGQATGVSVTGTDLAGLITFTPSGASGYGTVATVTFNKAFSSAPSAVILTPANSNSAGLAANTAPFVASSNVSSTLFRVVYAGLVPGTVSYQFYYAAIG